MWRELVVARASPFAMPRCVGGYINPAADGTGGRGANPAAMVTEQAGPAAAAAGKVVDASTQDYRGGACPSLAQHWLTLVPPQVAAAAAAASWVLIGRWGSELASVGVDGCGGGDDAQASETTTTAGQASASASASASGYGGRWDDRLVAVDLDRCAFPAYRRGARRRILGTLARTLLAPPPAAKAPATATDNAALPPLGYKQGMLSLLAVVAEAAFFRRAQLDEGLAQEGGKHESKDEETQGNVASASSLMAGDAAPPTEFAAALQLSLVLFAVFPALAAYYHPQGTADTLDGGVFPHALRLVRFWAPEVRPLARLEIRLACGGSLTSWHTKYLLLPFQVRIWPAWMHALP